MFKEEITQYSLMCQEWAEKYETLKQELQEIHKIANFTLWNYPTISSVAVYQNLEKILRIAENEVEECL